MGIHSGQVYHTLSGAKSFSNRLCMTNIVRCNIVTRIVMAVQVDTSKDSRKRRVNISNTRNIVQI